MVFPSFQVSLRPHLCLLFRELLYNPTSPKVWSLKQRSNIMIELWALSHTVLENVFIHQRPAGGQYLGFITLCHTLQCWTWRCYLIMLYTQHSWATCSLWWLKWCFGWFSIQHGSPPSNIPSLVWCTVEFTIHRCGYCVCETSLYVCETSFWVSQTLQLLVVWIITYPVTAEDDYQFQSYVARKQAWENLLECFKYPS